MLKYYYSEEQYYCMDRIGEPNIKKQVLVSGVWKDYSEISHTMSNWQDAVLITESIQDLPTRDKPHLTRIK